LMVGDDLNIDILPALQLGMQVFWVENRTITQQYGDLKSQSIRTLSAILNGQ
jgi:FMN phosphatase YigB (HAD superfamily)